MNPLEMRIVGGGPATAEEMAAVVIALTPVAPPDPAATGDTGPAWLRAAIREGVGGRRVESPSDLDVLPGVTVP